MNFDVNLLSNLMQMFANRPQQNVGTQGYPQNISNTQGYPQNNGSMQGAQSGNLNGYNNNSVKRMNMESSGKVAYQSTSFAVENGIGDNVRFEQPKANNTQTPPSPIFSLLQMMQGGQMQGAPISQNGVQGGQNGDALSSMLPLLMNLLKKPAQPTNTNVNDNENANNDSNGNDNNSNKNTNNNNTNQETAKKEGIDLDKNDTANDDLVHKKTQPSFFKPIAFAGYELMSALCKLYLTSALRHDR